MKKLTDYKDGDALELLGNLIEPCARIFQNKNVRGQMKNGDSMKVASMLLKECKDDIMEVLAILHGVPVFTI